MTQTSNSSTSVAGDDMMEPSRIHSLYQDLYLTDLKSELSTTTLDLMKQKQTTLQLENTIKGHKDKFES